jgi:hypothetical protein
MLNSSVPLDSVAHIIQVALTPVFLLSAIAALLNVFSTRLGRVADQVDQHTRSLETADAAEAARLIIRLTYLKRRSLLLDTAVVLGALGGAATGAAALTLFVGALRDETAATVLFLLFGGAILSTIGALGAFLSEILLAGRGIRAQVANEERPARPG